MLISQRSRRTMMRITPEPKPGDKLDAYAPSQATLGAAMADLAKREGHKPKLPNFQKGGSRPQDRERLAQRRAAVLAHVLAHGPVTAQEVADAVGIHVDTARDDLIHHRQRGKLRRRDKAGFAGKLYWEGAGE